MSGIYRCWVLFIILISSPVYAATGIVEVNTSPSGAKVYIDGIFVGKTPYANPEVNVGKHKIKVFLNDDYPAQYWEFDLDNLIPRTKYFVFENSQSGTFTGIEEEVKTEKHKGNVQFASVPTGAKVSINGKYIKRTPIGYRDVEVGRYDVLFELDGKIIKGGFSVVRAETVKLIADFNQNKLIDRFHERVIADIEKRKKEAESARLKKDREQLLMAERKSKADRKDRADKANKERERKAELAERERLRPKIIAKFNTYEGLKTLSEGKELSIKIPTEAVREYQLNCDTINIIAIESEVIKYQYKKGFFNNKKYRLEHRVQARCGSVTVEHYAKRSNGERWKSDFRSIRLTGGLSMSKYNKLVFRLNHSPRGYAHITIVFGSNKDDYLENPKDFHLETDSTTVSIHWQAY
jgi:hypothetical protein